MPIALRNSTLHSTRIVHSSAPRGYEHIMVRRLQLHTPGMQSWNMSPPKLAPALCSFDCHVDLIILDA